MIWSAQTIATRKPISPLLSKTTAHGRTYGLSSCGYDIRLRDGMWLFPFWGRLGVSVERFDMPNDVMAEVKDKSTNARRFIFVQNTVVEPGWTGYLTLEITRLLPWPVYLPPGMPIAQIIFKQLDEPTILPYRGKYQDQPARPVAAIMERSK